VLQGHARSRGGQQIRLCSVDGRSFYGNFIFMRLPVQLGENVALVDTVVIIDKNPGYLAADASGNERNVPVHIGVVSRDSVECQFDPRDAVFPDGRQHQSGQHPHSQPSLPSRPMICRRYWRCLNRLRRPLNRNAFLGSRGGIVTT
jgi:hypothetical protein